jgi:asparagine synthase (glutamine-hydrolysing)
MHRGTRHNVTHLGKDHVFFSQLAITDQHAPAQPYISGDYQVWLNGYISNYKELAAKYGIKMWTDCDTQVLADLFNLKGFDVLPELNGFFAIAVYDGQWHFFTDRYGIKQLYRYDDGETTYVCSELKGLKQVVDLEVDEEAVSDWKYSLGVMSETIYKGVKRVPSIPKPDVRQIDISYQDAEKELIRLLEQSFERNKTKLKSGVFLSGGVDSGIIAKWLKPDYSFSMDYIDEKYSEYDNIKLNSQGIHYTMICNKELADKYSLWVMLALDDFKVGSCYTNFALTELASKFCTVLYSGAGGDELFYGYTHRYEKPINDVIKRTSAEGNQYDITHEEYDWLYLRGILVVEDRMAGWHCMETRYPFLDNDLVNFVLSLPKEYRFNKKILKGVSGLQDQITQGRKRGFSNPFYSNEDWINHCLKYI